MGPGRPQVSVVMPLRDGAAWLPEAIASLEAQRFDDFEVIAVDDGSRDETPALIEAWARRDGRVRLLRARRRGIARALALGLAEARGPLLARMDGDDRAAPERLLAQVTALEAEPTLAVLGTHVRIFSDEGPLTDGMRRYQRWLASLTTAEELRRGRFIESPLCHPSVMARLSALRAVGGYRDVDGPEDYDLWLRLARAGAELANLPEVLLDWRDRPSRATRRDRRYRAEAILRLKLHYLLEGGLLEGAPEVAIWGAGPFGKGWARRLRRREVEVAFFVEVNHRKIGQKIQGAPVLAVDELPSPGRCPLLVAVGVEGARVIIRAELEARGWREGRHYLCVQ